MDSDTPCRARTTAEPSKVVFTCRSSLHSSGWHLGPLNRDMDMDMDMDMGMGSISVGVKKAQHQFNGVRFVRAYVGRGNYDMRDE